MTDGDALLAAILANPDEDTPRLVFADWVQEHGDEGHAEFIRTQVERSRLGRDDPRWQTLLMREAELLVAGKESWVRPYLLGSDFPGRARFHRGTVSIATTTSAELLPGLPRLREAVTLAELRLEDYLAGDPPPTEEVVAPQDKSGRKGTWLGAAWHAVAKLTRLGAQDSHARTSYLCRVSLADRPPWMRVRALIRPYQTSAWADVDSQAWAGVAIDLLPPASVSIEPALRDGEWVVLVWAAHSPSQREAVGSLARRLRVLDSVEAESPAGIGFAVRPVRDPREFAVWCPVLEPERTPRWVRLRDGHLVDTSTGLDLPRGWVDDGAG